MTGLHAGMLCIIMPVHSVTSWALAFLSGSVLCNSTYLPPLLAQQKLREAICTPSNVRAQLTYTIMEWFEICQVHLSSRPPCFCLCRRCFQILSSACSTPSKCKIQDTNSRAPISSCKPPSSDFHIHQDIRAIYKPLTQYQILKEHEHRKARKLITSSPNITKSN